MTFSSRKVIVAFGALAGVAALVVACGSSDDSTFNDGNNPPPGFGDGGFNGDARPDAGDLYKNDPPPKWCGPDGGPAAPPQPGGTLECPDDKNLPGCACSTPGQTVACWTGLRKNRNLGICKDGTTTCTAKSENQYVWGDCVGEVLPDPNVKQGANACMCFSQGTWKIRNLSPCLAQYDPDGSGPQPMQYTAVSTIGAVGTDGGTAHCPTFSGPPSQPTEDWSTDTLKIDCEGTFKLCLRIRVGDFNNPQPTDCILAETCADPAFYAMKDVEQEWPVLHSWIGTNSACAQQWAQTDPSKSPGYAEMLVKGESVLCDEIDDGSGNELLFNRIEYCPTMCQSNPTDPACVTCQQSGQGTFK